MENRNTILAAHCPVHTAYCTLALETNAIRRVLHCHMTSSHPIIHHLTTKYAYMAMLYAIKKHYKYYDLP